MLAVASDFASMSFDSFKGLFKSGRLIAVRTLTMRIVIMSSTIVKPSAWFIGLRHADLARTFGISSPRAQFWLGAKLLILSKRR